MSVNPRVTHAFEQLGATVREIACVIGQYRMELQHQGVPPEEAWALAQRLEERLAEHLFTAFETRDDP